MFLPLLERITVIQSTSRRVDVSESVAAPRRWFAEDAEPCRLPWATAGRGLTGAPPAPGSANWRSPARSAFLAVAAGIGLPLAAPIRRMELR